MAGMDKKPTGDIDRDFVVQMTAHHQGAIDMAVTMLKYGKNEQLKRMADSRMYENKNRRRAAASEPPALEADTHPV